MPSLNTLKDHFKESQLFLNRTLSAASLVILLSSVLLGRLAYLQIVQNEYYSLLARNNQVRTLALSPPRGLIYDRQGLLIAENIPAFSLELVPRRIANMKETLEALARIVSLTPQEIYNFRRQLKYKNPSDSIPLRIKLTEAEVAAFSLEKYRFPGVEVGARLIRHYPQNELYAHLLGYVGPITEREQKTLDKNNYRGSYHIGKSGIERFYEEELHGKVGLQQVETDARGRINRILNRSAPIEGTNLHLTVDTRLQQFAFDALQGERGAIVAMVPKTGEIRAFVSTPSFDPNLFAQGIPMRTYQDLQSSIDQPLFNRALRGQYPPASLVKPMVALQALERGAVNTSFQIFDPGWYQLNQEGRIFRDWERGGHGWTDLDKAITQSCDTFFWQLSSKLGIGALHEVYGKFGLGQPTGIDLSFELGGLNPSKEWKQRVKKEAWYPGETLNIVIGQGDILATPLQMSYMTAIIANRGERRGPQVVSRLSYPDQTEHINAVKQLPPVEIKKAYWEIVINAMKKVIHSPSGTAYRVGKNLTYEVAAKTGTAQVFSLKQNQRYDSNKLKSHLHDHGWFMAFAPASAPEIAIVVLVEHNSKISKNIARKLLDAYFELKARDLHSNVPEDTP